MKPNPIRVVLEELERQEHFNIPDLPNCSRECEEIRKKAIDSALESIARIVEGEKKEKHIGGTVYAFTEIWNDCCDHIAKLIRGKE